MYVCINIYSYTILSRNIAEMAVVPSVLNGRDFQSQYDWDAVMFTVGWTAVGNTG